MAALVPGTGCPVLSQKFLIASGISVGLRNAISSGSIRLTKGGAVLLISTISLHESTVSLSHLRLHSWMSQSPMMFFRNLVVPSMPPSLVKLSALTSSETRGTGLSIPISDQVPELMYTHVPFSAGTEAIADAVSCDATAIQGMGSLPVSLRTSSSRGPRIVPGGMISSTKS